MARLLAARLLGSLDDRFTETLVLVGEACLIGLWDVPLWITHDASGSDPIRPKVAPVEQWA